MFNNDDWKKNVKPITSKHKTLANPSFLSNPSYFKIKVTPEDFSSLKVSFDFPYKNTLKINGGKYFINGKLDLHGYTIEDAYNRLIEFIIINYQRGHRCVLVITGYGNAKNKIGLIRDNLSKWLNDIKVQNIILYHQQARKEDGGKGAFYILLRKNRSIKIHKHFTNKQ